MDERPDEHADEPTPPREPEERAHPHEEVAPTRASGRDDRRADLVFAGSVVALLAVAAIFAVTFEHIFALLLVSALLAYALLPLVDRVARRLPRSLATLVVALGGVGVLAGGIALAVPSIAAEIEKMPETVERTRAQGEAFLRRVHAWLPEPVADVADRGVAMAKRSVARAAPGSEQLTEWGRKAASGIGGVASGLLFVPVFVFLMLRGYHRVLRSVGELVPPRFRPRFDQRALQADGALSGFVRGQLLVALLLAVVYGTAFQLVGIPLGLVVGILAGLLEIVPFLGGVVALVFGTLLGLASGEPTKALWVVGIYLAVQGLEGAVLSPWIVGAHSGVRPVALIVALAIGGEVFGVLGLLAAAPVAAVLKVAMGAVREAWKESPFYGRGRVLA